jgi:hypothetical protein
MILFILISLILSRSTLHLIVIFHLFVDLLLIPKEIIKISRFSSLLWLLLRNLGLWKGALEVRVILVVVEERNPHHDELGRHSDNVWPEGKVG